MRIRLFKCILLISLLALSIAAVHAQTATSQDKNTSQTAHKAELNLSTLLAQARRGHRSGFSLMSSTSTEAIAPGFTVAPMATGPNLQVLGSGTVGHLTKWTGFTSSNSFIGDSSIFEDKFGNVTVPGMLQAGGGVSVLHDTTLRGNGTSSSPLGVSVPLILTGSSSALELLRVSNTAERGVAVFGAGGPSNASGPGGIGVLGVGGSGMGASGGSGVSGVGGEQFGSGFGGLGVTASGGNSSDGNGGAGISTIGGNGSVRGGSGVDANGGTGDNAQGGDGVLATGGESNHSFGGRGVVATGGGGTGAGNEGGSGITAVAGPGRNGATIGLAGDFVGDVTISGKLTVTSGMKMFHIDHPLDPENKYLNHVAVESAEVLNVYSGNITTDTNGDAVVTLPDWFEALNNDFRYQLTVVGTFAQAIIAAKIKGNRFAIKTNAPNVEVSWQVTGVRSDPTTRKFPLIVEEAKSERERGYYLNPDAYGQPAERGIEWARNPQMMLRLKQRQIETERKLRQQLQ